jgi:hypothetical protein
MKNGPGEIIRSLAKAVKAIQMYHISHPSASNFYNPLYEEMVNYLKEHPIIEYQIDKFKINYRGKPVYREEEKEVNIAFKLFQNGIRNISFTNGIAFDELIRFLKIISTSSKEEDIALELWEGDFEHINFYVVEEEDEIIDYKVPDFAKMNVDYDAKLQEIIDRENIDLTVPIEPELSSEELQKLRSEIDEMDNSSAIPVAITTLISYLNTEKVHEIINSLIELLELCMISRNFRDAIRIINKLNEYPDINPIARFETESIIVGFKDIINTTSEDTFNEFMSFISYFSKRAIPHLVHLMAFIKLDKRLHELRKAVAYIAQDDPTALAPLLKSDDINILVNAISSLALIRSKEIIDLLGPLKDHPDPLVRMGIITVYVELDSAALIAHYINDLDENVRIKALQALAKLKYTVIYYDLLRKIKNKTFRDLDFSEQREYFNCLVANGGHEVITELQKMLFKWILFGRKDYRIIRKLSAMALADIGTEHVLNILKEGARKRSKDINSACNMALRKT